MKKIRTEDGFEGGFENLRQRRMRVEDFAILVLKIRNSLTCYGGRIPQKPYLPSI